MGNDWNSFMQSKPARLVLNAICAVFCGYYAIAAVFDIVSPNEQAQVLINTMGQMGFTIMTVVRLLVCLWGAVAFGRLTVKVLQEKDEK